MHQHRHPFWNNFWGAWSYKNKSLRNSNSKHYPIYNNNLSAVDVELPAGFASRQITSDWSHCSAGLRHLNWVKRNLSCADCWQTDRLIWRHISNLTCCLKWCDLFLNLNTGTELLGWWNIGLRSRTQTLWFSSQPSAAMWQVTKAFSRNQLSLLLFWLPPKSLPS